MKLSRFAVCVLLGSSLWAQESPAVNTQGSNDAALASGSRRPRIGLVLEGGGALGLAHVGVLQWLEENRIPVDVIAGAAWAVWWAESTQAESLLARLKL